MGVPEVFIDAAALCGAGHPRKFQCIGDDGMASFGITNSGVQVDFPTHRPARAAIATCQNRLFGRCVDDGVDVLGNLVARIDTHQVRHMAMTSVVLGRLRGVFPLAQQRQTVHDFSRRALVEFRKLIFQILQEGIDIRGQTVDVTGDEFVPSQQRAVEQVPDELLRVGGGVFGRSLLRRVFIRALVGAVCCQNKSIQPEFATRLHCRPRFFEQEFRVERVAIVLPEVHTIPRIGNVIGRRKVSTCTVDIVFSEKCPSP